MSKIVLPDFEDTPFEHPVVKAITSGVPGVNILTDLWVDTVRSKRENLIRRLLSEIALAVNELYRYRETDIDLQHLASDNYEIALTSAIEIAIKDQTDEKKLYLKRFIANYSKHKRPDVVLSQIFIGFLAGLTGMHLVILEHVFWSQEKYSDVDLQFLPSNLDLPEVCSVEGVGAQFDLSVDLVSALCSGMEAQGLILMFDAPARSKDQSRRVIMQPLSRKFMKFVVS